MPDNQIQNIADEIKAYKPKTFIAIFEKGLKDINVPFPDKIEHYLKLMFQNVGFTNSSSINVISVNHSDNKYKFKIAGQPFSYLEVNDTGHNFSEEGKLELEVEEDPENPFFYAKFLWAPYDETLPEGYQKPEDDEYIANITSYVQFPDDGSGNDHKGYVTVGYLTYGDYSNALFPNHVIVAPDEEDTRKLLFANLLPNTKYKVNGTKFTTSVTGEYVIEDGVKFAETFSELKKSLTVEAEYEGKFKDHLTLSTEAPLPQITLYYRYDKPTVFDPHFFISPGIFTKDGNYWNHIVNRYYETLTIKYLDETITLPVGATSKEFDGTVNLDYLKSIPADTTQIKIEITNDFKYPWTKEIHHPKEADLLSKDYFRDNYGLKYFSELNDTTYRFEHSGVKAKYNNEVLEDGNVPNTQILSKKDFFKILKATTHEENYIELDADISFNYDYNTKLKLNIDNLDGIGFLGWASVPGYNGAFTNKFNIKKMAVKNADTGELLDTVETDGKDIILDIDIANPKYRFYKETISIVKVYIADDDNLNPRLSKKELTSAAIVPYLSTPSASFDSSGKVNITTGMYDENDLDWLTNNYVLDLSHINKKCRLTRKGSTLEANEVDLWKKIFINGRNNVKFDNKNNNQKLKEFNLQIISFPYTGDINPQVIETAKDITFPKIENWNDETNYIDFYTVSSNPDTNLATERHVAAEVRVDRPFTGRVKNLYFIDTNGGSVNEYSFEDGPVRLNEIRIYKPNSYSCTAVINYADKNNSTVEKEFELSNVTDFAAQSGGIILFNDEGL